MCILLGCDYCDTIKGIGPKRAVDLIKEHKSIEKVIDKLDKNKYPIPENWMFKEARELFIKPDVIDPEQIDLKWSDPDEEGIVQYMCKEKGFNEERMRNGIKKILKSRNTGTQVRLDSFLKLHIQLLRQKEKQMKLKRMIKRKLKKELLEVTKEENKNKKHLNDNFLLNIRNIKILKYFFKLYSNL